MDCGPVERIYDAFGWRGFPYALSYKAAYALRFQLAGDVEAGPLRLVRAMDRARVIADLAFATSQSLTAIVSHYGREKRTRRDSASLKMLAEIGFAFPFTAPDRVSAHDESHVGATDEDLYRYWYAADFHKSDSPLTALLWAALARELAIEPVARRISTIHIVDFSRKIAVHAYDDRGLDAIGPDRESLAPLYERLGEWLLEFDREAMDAKFGR